MPKKTIDLRSDKQLNALEMAHLSAMQARAEAATSKVSCKRLEAVAMAARVEAEVLRLQERHRQADAKVRGEADDLEADAKRIITEHDEFTRGLAAKYGVSWADCAYNETTGELKPLSP